MTSQNFDFLRPTFNSLADEATRAERHVHGDPGAAVWRLRVFAERAVATIYIERKLPRPFRADLNDCLQEEAFLQSVPRVVVDKLDLLRIRGNKAAHGDLFHSADALQLLREAFDIAAWIHLAVAGRSTDLLPRYTPPAPTPAAPAVDTKALHARAANLEKELERERAKFEALLAEAENNRKKLEEAERTAATSASELSRLKAQGEQAAKVLSFNERETRHKLIDALLLDAGWNVGENGKNTDEVGQEILLAKIPEEGGGPGFADYILWGDDGKPLAVIEAKKAAKDMENGRVQAWSYAVALEKQYGFRPVMFYTNGREIMIWDDVAPAGWDAAYKSTPRRLFGFYSKRSLLALIAKRKRRPLSSVPINKDIIDRLYQIEAVQRTSERFHEGRRKALWVLATGTGKTRVAIAFCELLIRAGWADRILFLCDRRELRKQAYQAFTSFLPDAARVIVSSELTVDQKTKGRVFLATYPAMMNLYPTLDPGFFDLVIADESHRSIYHRYRDLFLYFDALQLGLTATPVGKIDYNTYKLFGCENKLPTANYTLDEAVSHLPPYLVPPKVIPTTTKFLRKGIKYSEMTEEERAALEQDIDDPHEVEHEAADIDRQVFNRDTTRQLLRNLMEQGLRDATGTRPGKSIIFARNRKHAAHIREVFEEMYPQYGGSFVAVIEHEEPRAELLIDLFKDPAKEPIIAISIDMLDTGIDVPQVVNLVFAKPVKSFVKFWQMVGRGTRLCKDLFGPGEHKKEFYVFDPWGLFEYFGAAYKEEEPPRQRSLLERLFEARIELLAAAIDGLDEPLVQATTGLIVQDLEDLRAAGSLTVKERWRELEMLSDAERIAPLSPATRADLLSIAAPLMRERNIRGNEAAYRFDLLLTELSVELLRKGGRVADLRARVEGDVELLHKAHPAVKAKAGSIHKVRSKDFWKGATPGDIELLRQDLRGVMHHRVDPSPGSVAPRVIDVPDTVVGGEAYYPALSGAELMPYKERVRAVVLQHFASAPVLLRLKARKAVTEAEIEELARLILEIDDRADLKRLAAHDPITRGSLASTLRGLVGLEPEAVEEAFVDFLSKHPSMTAKQTQFLARLQEHIAKNGGMEVDRLFEEPFTQMEALFPENDVDAILGIVEQFSLLPPSERVE